MKSIICSLLISLCFISCDKEKLDFAKPYKDNEANAGMAEGTWLSMTEIAVRHENGSIVNLGQMTRPAQFTIYPKKTSVTAATRPMSGWLNAAGGEVGFQDNEIIFMPQGASGTRYVITELTPNRFEFYYLGVENGSTTFMEIRYILTR